MIAPVIFLLVDDEKFVGDAGKKMLEKLGYSVTLFDDPLQALEFLGQESDSVDLLITDETMPGLTGSQLAEIVRKYNMILPIVIVSGNLKPVKETENITFLSKPYTMSELQSTVSQAISREVAVN